MVAFSKTNRRQLTTSARFNLLEVLPSDEALFFSFYLDADRMKHLGGPMSLDLAQQRFQKWVDQWKTSNFGSCIIQDKKSGDIVGVVGAFLTEVEGETVYEIGWMVLKSFEGRGIAFEASKAVFDHVVQKLGGKVITAFPGASNVPSNRICEKLGMRRMKDVHYPYAGGILHSVYWRADV